MIIVRYHGPDTGVTIPDWSGRRAQEALTWVKAQGRRRRSPCCICLQPIDYSIPSTEPDGCTVQHVKSRKLFPHLTWVRSNWKPAHRSCNRAAGAGDSTSIIGFTTEDW